MTYKVTPVARDLIKALDMGDNLTAVYGGIRSGKTWAITLACAVLCQTRREWNPLTGKTKPIEILITRSTLGQIFASFMPSFKAIIEPIGGVLSQGEKGAQWIMPNGSIIHWRAYQLFSTRVESDSTIEGLGFSVVFGDEATQYPDEFFMHTIQRTSQPSVHIVTGKMYMASQVVWLSRPATDTRFLEIAREHHKNGMSGSVIISRTRDCQTPEFMDKLRLTLPPRVYEAITQDVENSTIPVNGAIYSLWSNETYPAGNVIDIELDNDKPTILVVDPGVNHTACLWIQHHVVKGRSVAIIVDEWSPPPPCRAQDIVREAHRRGWSISECIIDPAGNHRSAVSTDTVVQVLMRPKTGDHHDGPGLGCPVKAHIPSSRTGVKDGVFKVMSQIENANGERSLLAVRRIIEKPESGFGLRHTIDNYSWDPVTGEPKKGRKGKESDHIADCLRYWAAHYGWDRLSFVREERSAPRSVLSRDMVRPAPHRI